MYYYGFNIYYLVLVVPAILLSVWASARVNGTFQKFLRVRCARGCTGAQAARDILDRNGLRQVQVRRVSGKLTDHFDPRSNTVNLSDSVYDSDSVAAVGVAAHETGHAIQHATGYFPIRLRSAIIPVTNIGSKLAVPLVLLGMIMQFEPLQNLGVLLFATMALFQLVTLPVEFNASSRALAALEGTGLLEGGETKDARKVLSAAALTYVAALLVSLMQLLQLVLTVGRRRDNH